MSDFFGKLKSGAGKVAFEADKMTRLNRAKGDQEKLKNQIQVQYSKLGELYYQQHATIGVTGQAYDDICQAIVDLEQQVERKGEDIQRISADVYAQPGTQPVPQPMNAPQYNPPPVQPQFTPTPPPAPFTPPAGQVQFTPPPDQGQFMPPLPPVQAAAATKFCSNCGKEMPSAAKFCPDCGQKM